MSTLKPIKASRDWGACEVCGKIMKRGDKIIVDDGILKHNKCYMWRRHVERQESNTETESADEI